MRKIKSEGDLVWLAARARIHPWQVAVALLDVGMLRPRDFSQLPLEPELLRQICSAIGSNRSSGDLTWSESRRRIIAKLLLSKRTEYIVYALLGSESKTFSISDESLKDAALYAQTFHDWYRIFLVAHRDGTFVHRALKKMATPALQKPLWPAAEYNGISVKKVFETFKIEQGPSHLFIFDELKRSRYRSSAGSEDGRLLSDFHDGEEDPQ